MITTIYFKPAILRGYPLTSFLVIAFALTQFYFPVVFTFIEGKSLIFNLLLPYEVFFHSLAELCVLILTHAIYRTFTYRKVSAISKGVKLLAKGGWFTPPSNLQIWLMGCVGLGAMAYSVFFISSQEGADVSVADRVIQGLMPFSYAPYAIPFGRLYGKTKNNPPYFILMLAIFTLLLFLVSMGRNSRGAFMMGFTAIGFTYALGLLLGIYKFKILTFKNVLIVVLGVWLITGPISDLGVAMVLVRGERNDIPRHELIMKTMEAVQDYKAIAAFRDEAQDFNELEEWDEYYLDNIFLARFCNLKFNDMSLVLASRVKQEENNMLEFSLDKIWAELPQPFLNLLRINVDKTEVSGMSYGDYLRYLVLKNPIYLGSFLAGHMSGTGIAAFGWFYLLVFGVLLVPVFFLLDILYVKNYLAGYHPTDYVYIEHRFSLCALLNITSVFLFLPSESVISLATFLVRGWFQLMVLYFMLFHLTNMVHKLFMSK
ncbi:hypothetical protein JHJ32_19665 [Parapedobacter sp. ISTM3]|uniref:hypothetical protein n=1 Tax=Parapedobacter TaxID=416949 RepID=UPI001116A779|nr:MULTISPECIES: hypothetical protein [Parapedobacter]MBK1442224.1 hypothetical protein [Parapedobacter sp. ISTM3]